MPVKMHDLMYYVCYHQERRRKWMFFGKFKVKNRLASIAAPSSPLREEAEKEQSKHALSVALATAAAAEAAVVAAQAAAEVVLLTGVPHSINEYEKETDHLAFEVQGDAPHSTHQHARGIKELAAIKIQATFRGYLVSLFKLFSPFDIKVPFISSVN
jgi:hypothetical protein